MHILQAYETCDTQEWGSHACMLRSSVNIGSMKDIQTVKDSAKSCIGDLIRSGRWKKEAARNQTAFPTNSQGGGNSSDKTWKHNRSLSSGATHTRNGNTYQWCTGPGHGGRGMWVAHPPGTCKQQSSQGSASTSSVSAAQAGLTQKEKKKQKKELTALFTDNTLEPAALAAKVSELVNN